MTSIVTKTGDKGTTGLFGGERVPKDSPRIEAYGTVDELNACLGVAIAEETMPSALKAQLTEVQHLLFRVGGDLATPPSKRVKEDRIAKEHTEQIEAWIVKLEASLPPQMKFLLPGGSKPSAALHLARTVCRRAERRVVTLARKEDVNPEVRLFLNRLGDYLFLAARKANVELGEEETEVLY